MASQSQKPRLSALQSTAGFLATSPQTYPRRLPRRWPKSKCKLRGQCWLLNCQRSVRVHPQIQFGRARSKRRLRRLSRLNLGATSQSRMPLAMPAMIMRMAKLRTHNVHRLTAEPSVQAEGAMESEHFVRGG